MQQNKDIKLKFVNNDISSLNKAKRELTSFYPCERKNKTKSAKRNGYEYPKWENWKNKRNETNWIFKIFIK